VFTYGFGGLVYWLARRRHLVCPRCGLGWENASKALALTGPDGVTRAGDEPDEPLPSGGIKRRIAGTTLILLASLLVLIGFTQWEMVLVAVGSVVGGAGSLTFYWGWSGLQERHKALMQRIQRKVLRLASVKGGTLTVTEVAAELNLGLPAAEKILMSMDDDFRVRSVISDEGVIYYEFPELLHRKELGSGG
jgi:hypothetical protein